MEISNIAGIFTGRFILFITFLFTLFLLFLTQPASAEVSNNLADITKIIHESGRYDIHITFFDKDIETKKVLEKYRQNDPDQYLVEKDGKKQVEIYKPSENIKTLLDESLKLVEKKKYDNALKKLEQARQDAPGYSRPIILSARILILKKDYQKALPLLDEAINKNPIDFTAYKLRGDCELQEGKKEKALDDYISAIINNRNYKEAWDALGTLGKKMGFTPYNRPFVPLYSVQELDTGIIRIYYDDNEKARWMPYSYTKAVWQSDPEFYRNRTGKDKYEYTYDEEQECIKNTIWAYGAFRRQGNFPEDPMMERLKDIESRFFLREFILFEIMSPRDPGLILNLDEKYQNDLKDYIKEFILLKKGARG